VWCAWKRRPLFSMKNVDFGRHTGKIGGRRREGGSERQYESLMAKYIIFL